MSALAAGGPSRGWRRVLILLLLVAGAGAALYFSVKHEVKEAAAQEQALFPGFDPGRVRCVIAENVPRDWRIRIVRDARGGWALTDPSAVPANFWQVDHLLQVALTDLGTEVPKSERDPVQLGFSPPRLVLQIQEELDGKAREERVEVGGLDADGKHVNVRVRGQYLRVRRDLDTALDRQLDDFKTPLALEFTISDVVRVRRTGSILREGAQQPEDVGLELTLVEEGWQCVRPAGVQLDPALVGSWLQGLASVQHSGYFDELGAPLTNYGLDQPEMRIELEMRDGSKQALSVARPGHTEGQVWYGVRENLGIVWGLEQVRIWLIGYPLADMLDPRVLRARRDDITTLTLHSSAGELYFTHKGKLWQVAERRPSETAFDKPLVADLAKVQDLLGLLEKTELKDFVLLQTVPDTPEAPAVWVGIGGQMQGGWFGAEQKSKDGLDCVQFQRRGESACSLAPRALRDAVVRPIEEYWSRRLGNIEEHLQVNLMISEGARSAVFGHNSLGQWSRQGSDAEAKELRPVLDALCFLRAEKYLKPLAEPLPWDQLVTVEFTNAVGQRQRILIGRAREGPENERVEIVYDKQRAVAHDQDLHARLLRILEGP